jgi:hypothetical protein
VCALSFTPQRIAEDQRARGDGAARAASDNAKHRHRSIHSTVRYFLDNSLEYWNTGILEYWNTGIL